MADESTKITLEWLQGKNACGEGQQWFKKHFPKGGEIADVLRMVALDEANASWIAWLMQRAKYSGVEWLDNLTVGGSLYLSGTQITSLPDNLTVGGYLDLSGTQITSLPDNLTVGDYLYLSGSKIKKSAVPAHFERKVIV